MVRTGAARVRGQPRSATPASRSSRLPGGGRRAARVQVRDRGPAAGRSSASTGAWRWAGPSPRPAEDIVDARGRADPRGLRPAGAGRAGRGGEGDALLVDFEGTVDGKAFEGGKASDYLLELGSGQLIEGFEGQLAGASAGESPGRGQLSRGLPGRAAGRRGRRLQGRGEGGAGEGAAGARRRLRLRGLRVRHPRGAARRHRSRLGEAMDERIEQDFRDRCGRRRRRARRRWSCRRSLRSPRAEERWERVERQLASQRDGPRHLPSDAGENPRGGDRGVKGRRRSWS